MKTNETLQNDVQDAIKWEQSLNAAEIGVTAKDGVVTLSGTVDSYAKKLEAEEVTKNVSGVMAVIERIEINLDHFTAKGDDLIASEILELFRWNWKVPHDKVHVKVESGWVTLEGTVDWNYQKEAVQKSVQNVNGIINIANYIKIESDQHDVIEQRGIERALKLNWAIDDHDVRVAVDGNRVTLTGTVNSMYQKDQATRIVWNAPGVRSVDNELIIEHNIV